MQRENLTPEELSLKIENEWQRQQQLLQPLVEQGAKDFFLNFSGIEKAFRSIDPVFVCIDEGIEKRGFRVAGSGILMPLEDFIRYVQRRGIEGIYTHEGCGAAALAAKAANWTGNPDDFAKDWAEKAAKAAGIQYKGHIPLSDMSRPAEFHSAVGAYYIGSGFFSTAGFSNLPASFHVHRNIGKPFIGDLGLSIAIAMGDHGYGTERFTQNPFRLTIIGNPRDENRNYKALRKEAEEDETVRKFADLIVIDGFDAPDELIAA